MRKATSWQPENMPEAAQLPRDLFLLSPRKDPFTLIDQKKHSNELEKSNNGRAAACK